MKNTPHVCRYINKSRNSREMIIKWACMNPEIKDGDSILGKTVLLNLKKMNKCVFYPIKDNLTIVNCNFIGGKDGLKGELLKQFNLMIYRDELSVIV